MAKIFGVHAKLAATDFNAGVSIASFAGSTSGTFTPGAGAVTSLKYRRVGNSAVINFTLRQTAAGTNGVGNIKIPMPAGLVADTTNFGTYALVDFNTAAGFVFGNAHGNTGASNGTDGGVFMFDANNFCVWFAGDGLEGLWGNAFLGMANTTTNIVVEFTIPIVGWSSLDIVPATP